MSRSLRIAAGFALLVFASVFATGCAAKKTSIKNTRLERDVAAQDQVIKELQRRNADLERYNTRLLEENAVLETAFNVEQRRAEAAINVMNDLSGRFAALKDLLDEAGVQQNSNSAWEFQNELLFAAGKAKVNAKGTELLTKIANEVKNQKLNVIIVGHTDNAPVDKSKDVFTTETNLEVGFARALAVGVIFHNAGLAEQRLTVTSMGMALPKASNDTLEGRKANRRVEIFFVEGSDLTVAPELNAEENIPVAAPQK